MKPKKDDLIDLVSTLQKVYGKITEFSPVYARFPVKPPETVEELCDIANNLVTSSRSIREYIEKSKMEESRRESFCLKISQIEEAMRNFDDMVLDSIPIDELTHHFTTCIPYLDDVIRTACDVLIKRR